MLFRSLSGSRKKFVRNAAWLCLTTFLAGCAEHAAVLTSTEYEIIGQGKVRSALTLFDSSGKNETTFGTNEYETGSLRGAKDITSASSLGTWEGDSLVTPSGMVIHKSDIEVTKGEDGTAGFYYKGDLVSIVTVNDAGMKGTFFRPDGTRLALINLDGDVAGLRSAVAHQEVDPNAPPASCDPTVFDCEGDDESGNGWYCFWATAEFAAKIVALGALVLTAFANAGLVWTCMQAPGATLLGICSVPMKAFTMAASGAIAIFANMAIMASTMAERGCEIAQYEYVDCDDEDYQCWWIHNHS